MMKKQYKAYKKFATPLEVETWVEENYKEEELEKVSVLPYNPNKMALNLYKGSGYKRINTLLWRDKSDEIVEELTKLIEGYVIPQDIVVTRFVDLKEWWALLKGTVQGKAYEYKGFLSTTMLKKYFGMDDIKWGRVSIQIYIPKETHGVYLPEVNNNAKEFEILISPGQKLKRISCNKYAIII